MSGDFYQEHRKLIDARKAHLARVGIAPPEHPPLRDAMPSQADALVMPSRPAGRDLSPVDELGMPTTAEAPMLDATHPPALPRKPTRAYEAPKLPFDAPNAEE